MAGSLRIRLSRRRAKLECAGTGNKRSNSPCDAPGAGLIGHPGLPAASVRQRTDGRRCQAEKRTGWGMRAL